jgi:hypothetical protein
MCSQRPYIKGYKMVRKAYHSPRRSCLVRAPRDPPAWKSPDGDAIPLRSRARSLVFWSQKSCVARQWWVWPVAGIVVAALALVGCAPASPPPISSEVSDYSTVVPGVRISAAGRTRECQAARKSSGKRQWRALVAASPASRGISRASVTASRRQRFPVALSLLLLKPQPASCSSPAVWRCADSGRVRTVP